MMGSSSKRICHCTVLVFVFTYILGEPISDDDTVVIEAAFRDGRELAPDPSHHPITKTAAVFDYGSNPLITGPCISSNGTLGKCVSFRQCYPYFKLPVLNNWDTWVLGMYDTCNYFTAQGRQMFGVCCVNSLGPKPPPVIAEPDNSTPTPASINSSEVKPNYQWPPPLPTHSPDNTIPPLPTHPPSPGYPKPTSGIDITVSTSKPVYGSKPTNKPLSTTSVPIQNAYASCGAKNGLQDQERIVGGQNADLGEWPWIAGLFNAGRQFCGGSLLNDEHVLSAAHCVAHMSSWDVARLTVRLGDHNIQTSSEVKHVEKRVRRVVRHKGFDSRTLYNDIAILTLEAPVKMTYQVRSICLPSSGINFAGRTATVIGWGSIREMGPQPAILQEVTIPIWSNTDCKSKYGLAAPGGIVDHMICAGQASRDSCSGDSGGPLMVINNGKWTQVGIVSWGIGCGKGQYPGVYTRVEKFLPWIYKNTK